MAGENFHPRIINSFGNTLALQLGLLSGLADALLSGLRSETFTESMKPFNLGSGQVLPQTKAGQELLKALFFSPEIDT
jgi:hypothetical protein